MSQLSHAQFPLRRHPNLLVDHRRSRSAAVAEPRGANGEAVTDPGGRLQIGMVAGIKSERWPASNRNPRPDCVGIRTVALDQVRRSASESLRRWLRGAVRHQFLDELLQFSAPSPGDEQPDADGGVARRHGQNRGGGEGCGYAASLGQRKRVAHIPTAETEAARSGLILEGHGQASLHFKFNPSWSYEWGPVQSGAGARLAQHPVDVQQILLAYALDLAPWMLGADDDHHLVARDRLADESRIVDLAFDKA